MCGDWNARHKKWDRVSNRRGTQLARWATTKQWKIETWEGFSFRTTRYKGLEVGSIRSPEDVWTGNTQYRPVKTSILTRQKHTSFENLKISVKHWREEEKKENVLEVLQAKLACILEELKHLNVRKS